MYFYAATFLYGKVHLNPLDANVGEEFPNVTDDFVA